ncbi:helix-turn-helix domain-containing protein [Arthrobacter cavernae]|uniref:Helix-turn-helix domain-containing protein n=1 Tax=Arthrobacter cavernae TaxID=2817681 RepID=A0A939HIR8_9MICC|nr:helix-turn-helix domain-containing protein [Arthrobacter cavernae]MBO1269245.1 helix-turn-helix domain-containing protein [Arthrobacter cavernae]
MMGVDVERLLGQARDLAEASENLRQKQLTAAHCRQEAILSLHAVGLSIRDIASRLDCSPAVIHAAIKAARARRPHMPRREDRIPFELHVQLGLKLRDDGVSVRQIARAGIARMRQRPRNPIAVEWIDSWEALLGLPVGQIEAAMLADNPFAAEMRQMSPFAGALTDQERIIAIRKAATNAP